MMATLRSFYELGVRNDGHLYGSQQDILQPIAHDIQIYADYVAPGNSCDSNVMGQCLLDSPTDPYGDQWAQVWMTCSTQSQCVGSWSTLTPEQQGTLQTEFMGNATALDTAISQYQQQIAQDVANAQQTYGQNWAGAGNSVVTEAKAALTAWGCTNQTCLDENVSLDHFRIKRALKHCSCPINI